MSGTKRNLFLLLVLILLTFRSWAGDNRRQELIKIIDTQIAEIVRLGRSVRTNPRLLLQLAELNLEKARHLKDIENEKFLKIPVQRAKRINRKKFFSKSRHYIRKAENYCRTILKNFPRYPYKGDVYYIMAFNAKEFGNFKKAQRYFALAVKQRSSDPNIKLKAHIALADILYNQSKFAKAAKHYEIGLRKKIDQWWTKDAYNLAWCYYQIGRYNKGIRLLREIISKSRSRQYIDMSDQASRDLARFYVQVGRINEAVSFYKHNSRDAAKKLADLGSFLIGQSKYTKAIPVLEEARELATGNKDLIKQVDFSLLTAYGKFGKYQKEFLIAQELMKFYQQHQMSKDEQKVFHFKVKRNFAVLQQKVAGKLYQRHPKKRLKLARYVAEYGKMLKIIEPHKQIAYAYLTAEAFFVAKDYSTAKIYYSEALNIAKRSNNKKYIRLSLDGVAACLQHLKEGKDENKLLEVFNGYLALNPKNKKAHKIYQRLFGMYVKKGDWKNAELTFDKFRRYFRRDVKRNEAMLAQLLDHYAKNDDKKNFQRLYQKVLQKKILVSRKYARQIKKMALGLQFQDVQKASSDGEKKKALVLYVGIYRDQNSSQDAKKMAAYNIMRMFYMLGDAKRMYQWAERSLTHMSNKDILQYQSSFSKVALELFERRRFDYAYAIYDKIFSRICTTGAPIVEDGFNNMIVIRLADEHISAKGSRDINRILGKARRCNIDPKLVAQIRLDVLKRFLEEKQIDRAKQQYHILAKKTSFWNQLITPAYSLYQATHIKRYRKDCQKFFNYAMKRSLPVDVSAANSIYALKRGTFLKRIRGLQKMHLRFPVQRFNRTLEKKFKLLANLTEQGVQLVNLGSSDGIVEVYKELITGYDLLIQEIKTFEPKGKSAQFIKTFKSSMKGVVQALSVKRDQFYKDARKIITKHEILNRDNLFFYPDYDRSINHFSIYTGLIMDRGGIR